VFDLADSRLNMIARTELNRASNEGALSGYKQSGLKGKKTWLAKLDKDTSPICRFLNGKSVGLNEKFVYKGEEYDCPPSHPNCRSTLVFEVN
jgi:SPP1 gp7 family putative phage head morphogenesis protein